MHKQTHNIDRGQKQTNKYINRFWNHFEATAATTWVAFFFASQTYPQKRQWFFVIPAILVVLVWLGTWMTRIWQRLTSKTSTSISGTQLKFLGYHSRDSIFGSLKFAWNVTHPTSGPLPRCGHLGNFLLHVQAPMKRSGWCIAGNNLMFQFSSKISVVGTILQHNHSARVAHVVGFQLVSHLVKNRATFQKIWQGKNPEITEYLRPGVLEQWPGRSLSE